MEDSKSISEDFQLCQHTIQQWLLDGDKKLPQDIIIDKKYAGGFEWPSVLLITNKAEFHQFIQRNCIMRAMSRLVVLRINPATLASVLSVRYVKVLRMSDQFMG